PGLGRMRCVEGRCRVRCTTDAECPQAAIGGEGLHLCIDGGCIPASGVACIDDAACNPALLYCYGGGARCDEDADCGEGGLCVDRRCVPADAPAGSGRCSACADDSE